jgi:hypothetical protein
MVGFGDFNEAPELPGKPAPPTVQQRKFMMATARKMEELLQRSVVELLALYAGRGLLAFAHVPNGEYRTPGVAGRLKAMGTIPGVPDLLVWLPGSMSFGIELKAGRGRLSADQVQWHSTLSSLGHRVYVCRSIDEVEAALRIESVPAIGQVVA